ncbi:MAG: IclR family transcriptional regulator [Firmicutes bacterium]|nr:IclR family transcriptional regulator [Bacillota bacterium]
MSETNIVQSVDRALIILGILQQSEEPLGVTEIGAQMGLHKSSVYRTLNTLARRGYVQQDPRTERYTLGLKLVELGTTVLERLELRELARPYLKRLMEASHEVAHLVILQDGKAVYIEKVEYPGPVKMASRIGARNPLHCTAVGKAMLAFLPEKSVDAIIAKGLKQRTPSTITDPIKLREELEHVRNCGYACDLEENEPGIRCVAAPIFDHTGQVIAACSVSGLAMTMTESKIDECSKLVRQAGMEISAALGYRSHKEKTTNNNLNNL